MELSDYLQYVKDLQKNPAEQPQPSDLQPNAEGDTSGKKEWNGIDKTTKMDSEGERADLNESILSKLSEDKGTTYHNMKEWFSNPDIEDYDFESFLDTYENEQNDDETRKYYMSTGKRYAKKGLLNNEEYEDYFGVNAQPKAFKQRGKAPVSKDLYGEFGTGDPDYSSLDSSRAKLIQQYSNAEAPSQASSVNERYTQMENLCYLIAAGRSPKRHQVIYGDPG